MEIRKYTPWEWFIILAFSAMVVLIAAQVVFRYCFNNPLSWTEELARLLFVFGTFAAAVVAVWRGGHISIDLVFERLPRGTQKAIRVINHLLIISFMIAITLTSFPLLKASFTTPSAALRFPVSLFYIPVTISAVFIAYLTLRKLIRGEGDQAGGSIV